MVSHSTGNGIPAARAAFGIRLFAVRPGRVLASRTRIAPAPIDRELAATLQDAALRVHRALKLGGYSRIDFRADAAGEIFFLEANTLPGLTANSLIPKAARAAGMSFPVLCETICRLALVPRGTKR